MVNPLLNPKYLIPFTKQYFLSPGRINRTNRKQMERYRYKAFKRMVKAKECKISWIIAWNVPFLFSSGSIFMHMEKTVWWHHAFLFFTRTIKRFFTYSIYYLFSAIRLETENVTNETTYRPSRAGGNGGRQPPVHDRVVTLS